MDIRQMESTLPPEIMDDNSCSTVIACSTDSDCTPSPLLLGGLQFLNRNFQSDSLESRKNGDSEMTCSESILDPADRLKELSIVERDPNSTRDHGGKGDSRQSPVFAVLHHKSVPQQPQQMEHHDNLADVEEGEQIIPTCDVATKQLYHMRRNSNQGVGLHIMHASDIQCVDSAKSTDSLPGDDVLHVPANKLHVETGDSNHSVSLSSEDFPGRGFNLIAKAPPRQDTSNSNSIFYKRTYDEQDQLVPSPSKIQRVSGEGQGEFCSSGYVEDETQVDGSACMFSDSSLLKSSADPLLTETDAKRTIYSDHIVEIGVQQNSECGKERNDQQQNDFTVIDSVNLGGMSQKSFVLEKDPVVKCSPAISFNMTTNNKVINKAFITRDFCASSGEETVMLSRGRGILSHQDCEKGDEIRMHENKTGNDSDQRLKKNRKEDCERKTHENEECDTDKEKQTLHNESDTHYDGETPGTDKSLPDREQILIESHDVLDGQSDEQQKLSRSSHMGTLSKESKSHPLNQGNSGVPEWHREDMGTRSIRQSAGIHRSDVLVHDKVLSLEKMLLKVSSCHKNIETAISKSSMEHKDASQISKRLGKTQTNLRQIATEIKEVRTDVENTLRDVNFIYSQKKRRGYLETEMNNVQDLQQALCKQLKIHRGIACRLQEIVQKHTANMRENVRRQEPRCAKKNTEQQNYESQLRHKARTCPGPCTASSTSKDLPSTRGESTSHEDDSAEHQNKLLQELVGTLDESAGNLLVKFMSVLQGKCVDTRIASADPHTLKSARVTGGNGVLSKKAVAKEHAVNDGLGRKCSLRQRESMVSDMEETKDLLVDQEPAYSDIGNVGGDSSSEDEALEVPSTSSQIPDLVNLGNLSQIQQSPVGNGNLKQISQTSTSEQTELQPSSNIQITHPNVNGQSLTSVVIDTTNSELQPVGNDENLQGTEQVCAHHPAVSTASSSGVHLPGIMQGTNALEGGGDNLRPSVVESFMNMSTQNLSMVAPVLGKKTGPSIIPGTGTMNSSKSKPNVPVRIIIVPRSLLVASSKTLQGSSSTRGMETCTTVVKKPQHGQTLTTRRQLNQLTMPPVSQSEHIQRPDINVPRKVDRTITPSPLPNTNCDTVLIPGTTVKPSYCPDDTIAHTACPVPDRGNDKAVSLPHSQAPLEGSVKHRETIVPFPQTWMPNMHSFKKISLIDEKELLPYTEALPKEMWSTDDIRDIVLPKDFFEEIDLW